MPLEFGGKFVFCKEEGRGAKWTHSDRPEPVPGSAFSGPEPRLGLPLPVGAGIPWALSNQTQRSLLESLKDVGSETT